MRHYQNTHGKAVVSSKGQVVIPRSIRQELGIHAGKELYFEIRRDGVIEVKPLMRSIDMFFGRCKDKHAKPMTLKEMDDAIGQAILDSL